jgi:DNA-binding XRE family transcriptional regulator
VAVFWNCRDEERLFLRPASGRSNKEQNDTFRVSPYKYHSGYHQQMESGLRQNLAANLRRLRSQRGLSQDELADICGLHRTFIGGIERGERNITIATLEKIAESLNIDPISLITQGE